MKHLIRGDLVHVVKKLDSWMSHFRADADAIIMEVGRIQDYGIMFTDDGCPVWWYPETTLTFINHVGEAGIKKVEDIRELRKLQEQDINWILTNWATIRSNPSGFVLSRLMSLVGITKPWGMNGEGINLYYNQHRAFDVLDPYLQTGSLAVLNEFLMKHKLPPAT